MASYRFGPPEELIAKEPVEPRDHARLLVYDRSTKQISHRYFYELPAILPANVSLVANTSKVFMARTMAKKVAGSSEIEVLFVRNQQGNLWETLMRPGKRIHVGQSVRFVDGSEGKVVSKIDGLSILEWNNSDPQYFFAQYGALPLPPYLVGSQAKPVDYQTVYANQIGSSAAPTAGLHFTEALWQELSRAHPCYEVCLHVGLGTFKPIQEADIRNHQIHEEYIELEEGIAEKLNDWKTAGNKVCAVGTTSLRTLESCFLNGKFSGYKGTTELYLYPGRALQAVDILITNFHTPESSLLVLVASMIGLEETQRIYAEAIKGKYRFFSFGDAMIVL